MIYDKKDIDSLEQKYRLNLINSITGIKPVNLIATNSLNEHDNLAIFSSVVHLGSDPALIGFIMRPTSDVPRDTYKNIIETGFYTINHVAESFIDKAHYTSAKFTSATSEFEQCALTQEYINEFPAPFVAESIVKFGLNFIDDIKIKQNNTHLIIGEVQKIIAPDNMISELGYINLEESKGIGISGLNRYYGLKKIKDLPYVRLNQVPKFGNVS